MPTNHQCGWFLGQPWVLTLWLSCLLFPLLLHSQLRDWACFPLFLYLITPGLHTFPWATYTHQFLCYTYGSNLAKVSLEAFPGWWPQPPASSVFLPLPHYFEPCSRALYYPSWKGHFEWGAGRHKHYPLLHTQPAFAPLPTHIIRSLYNLLPTHSPIPLNLVYFLNACWSHMESCGSYTFSLIYFLWSTFCMSPDSIFILKQKTQHLQIYVIFPF